MSSDDSNLAGTRFWTPPPLPPPWKKAADVVAMPMSETKSYNAIHKVPGSDSPYGKAKHVQLIDKDPSKAISLFWAAINSGDRVDSALKDMACVMKQLDRSDEAIEAIKSFRNLCPYDSQVSLDNLLVELYKRSGRVEEEIEMLQCRLKSIEEGIAFGPKRTKTARSQGRKVQITVEQEKARILGNLAWAYLQQHNYGIAEKLYRQSLSLEPDMNRQCNLAVCLMHMNRITEAKSLVDDVKVLSGNRPVDESYAKSYERAVQMLCEIELRASNVAACEPLAQESENLTPSKLAADRIHTPASRKTSSSVLLTQPRRCPGQFSTEVRRRRYGGNAGGTLVRRLTFEQNVTVQGVLSNPIQHSEDEKFVSRSDFGLHKYPLTLPSPREDWKRPKRTATKDNRLLQSPSYILVDVNGGCNRHDKLVEQACVELTEVPFSQPEKSCTEFDHGDGRMDRSVVDTVNSPVERLSFGQPTTGMVENLNEPIASSTQPALDKKSWADMVEEEEEVSPFGEWNNEKGINDENLNCNIVYQDPSRQDEIENMSLKFGSFSIKARNIEPKSSVSSKRNRLQVFRNITSTLPGSP